METFWEYFSVLAPSVGLALIFWLVMRSLFRVDSSERSARAELEEREAQEWARLRGQRGAHRGSRPDDGGPAVDGAAEGGAAADRAADSGSGAERSGEGSTAADRSDDGGAGGRGPGSGVIS